MNEQKIAATTAYEVETTTYVANNPTNHEKVREELSCRYSREFQTLCEGIDNSTSDFRANGVKDGVVEIVITNNDYHTITTDIYDNGTGVKDFEVAISLGNTSARETEANSHAFGVKALSYLAIPGSFVFETTYMGVGHRAEGALMPGHTVTMFPNGIPGLEHGTHLSYELPFKFLQAENKRAGEETGAGHITNFFELVEKCLCETLALYYGDQMQREGYKIIVTAIDGEDTKTTTIKPLNPVLTVLSKKDEQGNVEFADRDFTIDAFNGDGVIRGNAKLVCIEKAADSTLRYWSRAQVSSGIYIQMHHRLIDRVPELRRDVKKHPSANNMAIIVNLECDNADQAPRTEVSKTHFIDSAERSDLVNAIYDVFPDMMEFVKNCEDILNETFFTRMWGNDLIAQKMSVELFPRVPGKSGQANDMINHTTQTYYEIKLGDAGVSGVRQIEGYVRSYLFEGRGMPFKNVVLVAEYFNPKALQALAEANFFLKYFGVRIEHRYLADEAGESWKKFNAMRKERFEANV